MPRPITAGAKSKVTKMRIGEFRPFLVRALAKRKRILAVGAPGVGKTYGFLQAAGELGWESILMCSALEDPSTIRGYPSRGDGGEATHCLFDGIARAFRATKPTVLVFDDLGMASESTMRSIVRLIQFGEIDNRRLPDCVVIGAATNDVGHGAGVYGMIEPLKSRFHSIINVETHVDDVVGYGLSRDWPAWLLAFLRNSPDAIHDWKPEKSMKQGGACPRGWEYVAEWDNDGFDDVEVWSGAVGKGQATAARAFKDLIADLPDIAGVLLAPDSAPVPENPSARWLVSLALAGKLTAANFGQGLKYLLRLPQPFRAFTLLSAFRAEAMKRKDGLLPKGWAPIQGSRDFVAWTLSTDGKEILSGGGVS
jgi:hypothetical protein